MSQIVQSTGAPQFASISLQSSGELPVLLMEDLKKLNSPLVLVNIDDFKIADLTDKMRELQRLDVTKIGFSASREQLSSDTPLSTKFDLSQMQLPEDELCKFLDWTQDEAVERMPFNAPGVLGSLKESVRQHARTGETLVLAYNSDKIATCIGFDMVINGELTTLISWVWIKSNAPGALKPFILSQIKNWLAKTAQSKLFASINIENERSINFFSKLGFKPSCLFVRP